MAVQQIAPGAYVLTPTVGRATDSRGQRYGASYTTLKWKMWEEIKGFTLKDLASQEQAKELKIQALSKHISNQQALVSDIINKKLDAAEAVNKYNTEVSNELLKAGMQGRISSSSGTSESFSTGRGSSSSSKPKLSSDEQAVLENIRVQAAKTIDPDTGLNPDKYINELVRATDSASTLLGMFPPEKLPEARASVVNTAVDTIVEDAVRKGVPAEGLREAVEELVLSKVPASYSVDYSAARDSGGLDSGAGVRTSTRSSFSKPAMSFKEAAPLIKELELNEADYDNELMMALADKRRMERELLGLAEESPVDTLAAVRANYARVFGSPELDRAAKRVERADAAMPLRSKPLPASPKPELGQGPLDINQRLMQVVEEPGGEPKSIQAYPEGGSLFGSPGASDKPPRQQKLPALSPAKGTDLSSKDKDSAYKTEITLAANELYSQKDRFNRIRKSELPAEIRTSAVPKYIKHVEDIYGINSESGEKALKKSWDEIRSAYADNPEEQKKAHTYLVALHLDKKDNKTPLI